VTRVVIVGGGPGGYEAALVGAQLGAEVTLVDSDGVGGSAVLTDCVPSKALVATADAMSEVSLAGGLGVRLGLAADLEQDVSVDLSSVNSRIRGMARQQSTDISAGLSRAGVDVVRGLGRLVDARHVQVRTEDGFDQLIEADFVLLATGARPRVLPQAQPDGDRILTWTQVYDLQDVPERLVVVGSGVTGAEFASAFHALGSDVVLVSSRTQVLPGEDQDAAAVLERVFARRGLQVIHEARAASARRNGDGVLVTLTDGREVAGSHCLMAVGSLPNTEHLGLPDAGVRTSSSGHIEVDRVSRTSAPGIYAAGDCTGVFMLASVAAMQGRTAMWHALGDAVSPLDLAGVSSSVFTTPEIATVGVSQQAVDAGQAEAVTAVTLPLSTNPRAKMRGIADGFVKVFCRRGTGVVVGGVVVAPQASELIHPITVAVQARVDVDQLATAFTVYPSLSGSVAEAARRLHLRD
jgi:pyruvate/2-oxoglutarate dehydrogenase complex dihydrolipoamide dehydrogenase (E3) component